MLPTRYINLRKMLPIFCGAVLGLCTASVHADPQPLSKEEQAKVDKAIDKGVAFLKRSQLRQGDWLWKMYADSQLVGQCALPAYALLEAGVPADDPVIQKAAEYIRPRVLTNDRTYELSLAILFFDRLADSRDKKLAQTLALRLIAGQHHTGGWAYRCPILSEKAEQDLLNTLELLSKPMRDTGKTREQALAGIAVPPTLQSLPVFRGSSSLQWPEPPPTGNAIADSVARVFLDGRTDNSNTQFAILGLWAAQRNGLPLEPTFEILVERFERSQNYPAGTWWYSIDDGQGSHSPSMICVGLKGLAIGRGLKLETPGAPEKQKDVHVLKGFAALRRRIGQPSGKMDQQKILPDYYFLWSVERVAMLYNLPTIGDKDWYRWGAEALVTNQSKKVGGWVEGASSHTDWNKNRRINYKATLNTSFALLFLKRSHPMKDLTPKLPVTGKELNQGIAQLRPNDKFPFHRGIIPAQRKDLKRSVTTPSESRRR